MKMIVRGNEVEFIATFTPPVGSTAEPTSAKIRINFVSYDTRTEREAALSKMANGSWVWVWDSRESTGGRVYYWARCEGGLVAADEGSFMLSANAAND